MKEYFSKYPISNPSYMIMRRSGYKIRFHGNKYFRGRLLDIGCGTKDKKYLIGDLVQEYIGLDHENSLHDKSLVDIFGTAYHIPQPDSSYDCILCTAVLEHLEEPFEALRESYRVLKEGGYAIYTIPLFWPLHEEPRDFYRYTKFGIRHLFEKAGYEIVELEPLSGFWINFLTLFNYYICDLVRRQPLRWFITMGIMLNNTLGQGLHFLEMRFVRDWERWTWMYLVVARKGSPRSGP